MVVGLSTSSQKGQPFIRQAEYKAILSDKLLTQTTLLDCETFMLRKAPRHTARLVTSWPVSATVPVLPWPGNRSQTTVENCIGGHVNVLLDYKKT